MKRRTSQPGAVRSAKTALVEIEKPIYGGAFLARLEGKATFVPLTLPGEHARVRIIDEKRSYATAEPEEITAAAQNRVQPRCPHFGECGGCSYQHTNYETQLTLKEQILRETLQRGGVQVPDYIDLLAGEPWSYRNRIRLAFDAGGRAGYRGRRSHEIFPIHECPIASPLLVKAALQGAEVLRDTKPAFTATEISLFCDAEENALLTSIFVSEPATKGFNEFAAGWKERIPELNGVECVHQALTNETPKQIARWGEQSIVYRAAGFDYRVGHGAFFQVNRWLIDRLVQQVVGVHRGRLAWDLFAGVGLFARELTERFEQVIAVESAPSAIQSLKGNLRGTSARSVPAETLSFLMNSRDAAKPDLIVVDPPRAGLGSDVTASLGEIAAGELVYVSCDPSTLARDLKALIASGYSIASVTLADLFPQTFHLETVVTLRRS
jgi:23S rRNA (uracil1939-C5)-methyltransferase